MTIKIRDELRGKGYQAKCVNGSCYDINQNGFTHYLSGEEGEGLNNAKLIHPVNLHIYAERRGFNLWYDFTQPNKAM